MDDMEEEALLDTVLVVASEDTPLEVMEVLLVMEDKADLPMGDMVAHQTLGAMESHQALEAMEYHLQEDIEDLHFPAVDTEVHIA